jgi:tRNA dimethylallyltransferase
VQAKQKTVIVVAGPTAVGKTAVGIEIAKHFSTEIISADSRQCFRELNIGVARPSAEELAQVPHHFIASHSIHEKVTAATFEAYALSKAAQLFQQHDAVVMVGGTGLYIKAFCEGMDEIPEVPEQIHKEVVAAYNENGLEWLQKEIKSHDPRFWEKGETKNPQRLMRALEVIKVTGQSILDFRKGEKKQRPFSVIKIALDIPREMLHCNINHRVDKMMERGLLEEVKELAPYQHLNALQTVGYKELFQSLIGETSLSQAAEAIKQNTRQYAKRQLTWFRKDKEFTWSEPDAKKIIPLLEERLVQS